MIVQKGLGGGGETGHEKEEKYRKFILYYVYDYYTPTPCHPLVFSGVRHPAPCSKFVPQTILIYY